MPASAGRTTMCPTELGYDAALPPSLCLLPIETRLQSQGLAEVALEAVIGGIDIPLDIHNPEQVAKSIEKSSADTPCQRE